MRWIPLVTFFLFWACSTQNAPASFDKQGKLFIIGGGERPPALIQELIEASGIDKKSYAFILPMASSEPDTAAFYAIRQFVEAGISESKFTVLDLSRKSAVDSLKNANLIYITGGDQVRFMEAIVPTPAFQILQEAYRNGATIAGTSAGAAIMGQMMITGNEFKHPKYTGDFRTIEANNLEKTEGMGFLGNCIVDQHFIYRMRMNRLITAILEHPEQVGIGIDESTAILVEGKTAKVVGSGQVIVLKNKASKVRSENGLLAGDALRLAVFIAGDRFALP